MEIAADVAILSGGDSAGLFPALRTSAITLFRNELVSRYVSHEETVYRLD